MTGVPEHFLFAVSSHGYGHLAQLAPVINALKQQYPELSVSIQTTLPPDIVSARINCPFKYLYFDADVGLLMDDAVTVNTEASRLAYRDFHSHWELNFKQQTDLLQANCVDLLIADIPYLPLLAAQQLDIKTIAVCSLNWVDILSGYFQQDEEMAAYMAIMRQAYCQAEVFLKPRPSMPMSWLPNGKTIEPLVTTGTNSRTQLLCELSLQHKKDNIVLVLLALGGIDSHVSVHNWPDYNHVHLILQDGYHAVAENVHQDQTEHSNKSWLHNINDISLAFTDIVQSVDVIITKPGYGLFAEAAFGAKPIFYVGRRDWPEEVYLLQWLKQYVAMLEISKKELTNGIDEAIILDLAQNPEYRKNKKRMMHTGVQEAVKSLMQVVK